jgi:putative toxin-antitoxin system antitoxin component (TIGR02293 family)
MATTEELVEVLGGKTVLKKHRVHTIYDLDRLVQEGLPYQALVKVMERFRLGLVETQRVLLVPPRTLARRKGMARMKAAESDRLMRLARVGAHAVQVFGTDEKAATWLHRPNRALNNRTPLDLLQTDLGRKQVEDVLSRIEHGVMS